MKCVGNSSDQEHCTRPIPRVERRSRYDPGIGKCTPILGRIMVLLGARPVRTIPPVEIGGRCADVRWSCEPSFMSRDMSERLPFCQILMEHVDGGILLEQNLFAVSVWGGFSPFDCKLVYGAWSGNISCVCR